MCNQCKEWMENKHQMEKLPMLTPERILPPEDESESETTRAFYQSRFGRPEIIKSLSVEASSAMLEVNDDLEEISLWYDNAMNSLSYGIKRKNRRAKSFYNVFFNITTYDEIQPLCVYFATRGIFPSFSLEYFG